MDELHPGERIDSYKITQMLHAGEMAHVYKAVDLFYNKTVALKVPIDDIFNRPILYYQYQNEECIGRYLDHNRVVRFLRRDRSRLYLVMEYIEGENLRALLNRKKRLPQESSCNFILSIAEGVAYLHAHSIIHLDLKPDNIMFSGDHKVTIIDFGLANHLGCNDLLARDLSGPKGTPYYIAPEQFCGKRNYKESDIYSLGILFYEMLTGKLPFARSKKLSRVRERLRKDPVPPRFYDKSIPPSIQQIILKSLERKPEERYRSIEEFITDLEHHKELPRTIQGELVTKPLPLHWVFNLTGCSGIINNTERNPPIRRIDHRQILACIIDHDYSDLVVEQAKREVLLRGGEITLLTVTEDNDDSLVKYATAVEGRNFSRRLDRYISTLQRYGLAPTLRIRKGLVSEVITATANEIDANTIILGPPRPKRGLSGIFSGSKIQKVIKQKAAKVVLAEAVSPASPPFFTNPDNLTPALLAEIDLFLTDTWVYHLNWFSESAHNILDGPPHYGTFDETSCHFGTWLARLPKASHWAELVKVVTGPHKKFHQAVQEMAAMGEANSHSSMVRLYHDKALPLSAAFREGLQKISNQLRQQAGN